MDGMLFVGNKFSTFVPLKHQLKNKNSEMKKGIHPENYRLVAFKDMSNDHVDRKSTRLNSSHNA